MNKNEPDIDRKKHMIYSAHAKKVLLDFIHKEYGGDAETVWETVQKKYAEFLKDAPDYGGKKSPHAAQIYDAVLLMSFCACAPKKHTVEELQPVAFDIFMSAFKLLGKFFDANNKWVMDIANSAFESANKKANKHAKNYPDDFTADIKPYDSENGIVRYNFTKCPLADFAKKHGLENRIVLCCNCDHIALGMIHASLIRTGTCVNSDACDYCICGDKNPLAEKYELVKDENGLLLSKRKENAK
ncbi:MAG: L-2-amino-thiazoline-4-carboxylic acid hydrolase [Ruminococcus sp.]|nr:L-2-amino-thiazoline-4-carboxylic acid hydrolase [Ruminococcus sp.]